MNEQTHARTNESSADVSSYNQSDATTCETNRHPDLPCNFANLSEQRRDLLQHIISVQHHLLTEGELLAPFYLIESDSGAMTVEFDNSSDEAMLSSTDRARATAMLANAKLVMFVSESLTLPESERKNQDAILAEYGSVSNYPGSQEVLLLHVETCAGRYYAMVPILPYPPSKNGRALGEVIWQCADKCDGSLVGILPLDSSH